MTRSWRAAVLTAPGERLRIEAIEAGRLQAGEVLVHVAAAARCHTDPEVIESRLRYPTPIVLGHQAAGTIEAVAAGMDKRRVGEPMVLSCPRAVTLAGTTRLSPQWQPLRTMMDISGFAEYAVVTASCAVAVSTVCAPAGRSAR